MESFGWIERQTFVIFEMRSLYLFDCSLWKNLWNFVSLRFFEVSYGFNLIRIRKNNVLTFILKASEDLLKDHYADLSSKPFFAGLVKYMSSGPVVPMVWEGLGVVKTGRVMLGETNPKDSAPGTIRGDYCVQVRLENILFC